jgi:Tat protein translocase TatB subunit
MPFDVGLPELVVIFVVVLLVMGPERVPEVARTIGRVVRDVRHTMNDLTRDFTAELQDVDRPPRPQAVCTVCGALNQVDAKFCAYCGRDLSPATPGEANPPA